MNRAQLYEWFMDSVQAPLLCVCLLLVLIVLSVWGGVTYFLPPSSMVMTQRYRAPLAVKINIKDWHLFGVHDMSLSGLPETHLQIVLQGTELAGPTSHAIVSSPNGHARSYAINQTLPGGAVLHGIEKARIILDHNGVMQQLKMHIPVLKKSSPQGVSVVVVK